MKKILLICFLLLFPLCGCGVSEQRREVEQLLIIQTVGVDYAPGGMKLSLAAASDREQAEPPPALTGSGPTFSAALERIRDASVEEELFTGHMRGLLVGEEAAVHGLEDLLGAVCRSADLRLDMPLYLVRGGTAEKLVLDAGSEERGISEILRAADAHRARQQGIRSGSAGTILRSLIRRGGALAPALRFEKAAEDGGNTAVPAGYGVLAEGKLCAWIEPDEALGADLLRGVTAGRTLDVLDLEGMPATLELQRGTCRLLPVWDADGGLHGLDVTAQVRAAVLETAADSALGTEAYDDHMTAQLESAVSDRIGRILRLERQLSLDFLGLEDGLRLSAPERWGRLTEPLGALLPGLEISITVRGEIAHSFDAKDT